MDPPPTRHPNVVIVGAGFAGMEAAKALAGSRSEVTLIDRHNHHCFQPLLYQVATAALSPADVAWPIRHILRRQENATVLMAEVTGAFGTHGFGDGPLRLSCRSDGGHAFLFRP